MKTSIVIPCYNEAKRLELEQFDRLLDSPEIRLIFVDDGSTDGTKDLLDKHCQAHPGRMDLITLTQNMGKGEAVRQGLLFGLEDSDIVGYIDADLATPVPEIIRLTRILEEASHSFDVVLGSRVQLLGRRIRRRAARHYAGRVFATFASLILGIPVYDTQCGAKFFRRDASLKNALEIPFHSRWVFDVELIGRLLKQYGIKNKNPLEKFREVSLEEWNDIPGSKITLMHFLPVSIDLLKIYFTLR